MQEVGSRAGPTDATDATDVEPSGSQTGPYPRGLVFAASLFGLALFAMAMGRYALLQLREFGAMELSVSEPPYGEFPNTSTGSRAAAIYAGSEHKDLAGLFLAFLASEDYNMQIVDDADALPPNPAYAETELFLRPPKHPNEWGSHERFSQAVREIAIGGSMGPFVSPSTVNRIVDRSEQAFMSELVSAQEAGADAEQRINAEIDRTLSENPKLLPRYRKRLARQAEIDELVTACRRAERQGAEPLAKVPLAWIDNVFHRRYYLDKGWAE